MPKDRQILYKEVQRFPKWTWIFVITPALIFWGIRVNKHKWGFIIEGKEGIELVIHQAKPIVIATKHKTELFNAINQNLRSSK
ncbi:hypothetical protein NQ117_02975 [Paenibacillus sp. SC116]|uniref:hypothetical protein n=1 Tax=Paenibacillus sp. SC116 TaxID=2968986 RepID=UPI00215B2499|nr:hypothetical protein [Paenibacillus sp. SC116]MCR8842633.1 hypothetical protein [Paenibacillus sp. SC116]